MAFCSPELCSVGVPPCGCVGPSVVAGLTTVGMLVVVTGSQPVCCSGPAECEGC